MNEIRIVDTTLRDGEQAAGIALGAAEKVEIAKALDALGIYQIEAGIPAMGGEEKRTIMKIMSLGLCSRISVWNRLHLDDIRKSMSCGPVIIHICVPTSDIQIGHKLGKSRRWVTESMKRCISFAKERGYDVVVGMEDASRADLAFLKELLDHAKEEGVERVRYADTVGILHREKAFCDISALRQHSGLSFEIHAHNDLGMAVANSLAAVNAGAAYVNTTVCGIGERAGNCNLAQFIAASKASHATFSQDALWRLSSLEALVLNKMKLRNFYSN